MIEVEGQPLAANVRRLVQALEFLGAPLPTELRAGLAFAGEARDAAIAFERFSQYSGPALRNQLRKYLPMFRRAALNMELNSLSDGARISRRIENRKWLQWRTA